MKSALLIEYKNTKKSLRKTLKVYSSSTPHVIGTARRAKLRVVGSDISAYHAGLEYRDGDWYVCDLASESGTWINKENIIDQKIEKELSVRIGDYDFNLKVIPPHHGYFNHEERRFNGADVHEVIVKCKNQLIETKYLEKNEPYLFDSGVGLKKLDAPLDNKWVTTTIGEMTVQQRLIPNPEIVKKDTLFKKQNIRFQLYTAGAFLLLALAFILYPRAPKVEMPASAEQNKYARLIYDAKLVQEKRSQSKNIVQHKQKESPASQGAKGAAAPAIQGASQKTTKAISQIRASGLNNLLGKIAARANVNAETIQVNAGGSGKAATAFSGSSVTGTGTGNVKATGQTVGISGVTTTGKGGGGEGYKGLGKLSQGEIGNAQVGMLDEEADISGGMDRDAIAEVIRKNIGQVRFCYERRLAAVPSLFGKVLVQFSIQEGGTVLLPKVSSSTLSDSVVEGCILRRLASWKFPSPPAGTSVVVTYPFLFKSTQ